MIYAVMLIDTDRCYTFRTIHASDYLFPFDYQVGKEALLQDHRFAVTNLCGELGWHFNKSHV